MLRNEFRVGLMVLAAMVGLIFMAFKITSNQSGFGEYLRYRTILEDASGIFPKTPIKMAGINAGRIVKIELQGNKALITFEILSQIKITQGSTLRIKSIGFLGDKYLEVVVGDSEVVLAANSFIESIESAGMETLVKDATEIVGDVKIIIKDIKKSLATSENGSVLSEILSGINEVVKNINVVTLDFKELVQDTKNPLQQAIGNLQEVTEQLAFHLNTQEPTALVSDLKKLGPILDDLKAITADFRLLANNVKNGKGSIGQILVQDEIADQVRTTLASVNKVVNRMDTVRTQISVFNGFHSTEKAVTEASLRLYASPERYYEAGVKTAAEGRSVKKRIVTDINGVRTVENREVIDRDTFRFNLILGRMISNFELRGGIIESTGGLALDYHLRPLGTKFSLEAFDYRDKIGPQLRLASEVHLWNVLYGRMGLEDLIVEKGSSFSLTAGLKFNDEDLKGLLSLFLK